MKFDMRTFVEKHKLTPKQAKSIRAAFHLGRIKEREHLLKLLYQFEEQGGTSNLMRALEWKLPFRVWSPLRAKIQPRWVEILKERKGGKS